MNCRICTYISVGILSLALFSYTRSSFEQLHQTLQTITNQDGQAPDIVFEATGVYSKPLERFFQDYDYLYCRINSLEANLQMASMRR